MRAIQVISGFLIVLGIAQLAQADALDNETKNLSRARKTLIEAAESAEFKNVTDSISHKLESGLPDYAKVSSAFSAYRAKYGSRLNEVQTYLAMVAFQALANPPSLNEGAQKVSDLAPQFTWKDALLNLIFDPEGFFKGRDFSQAIFPEKTVEMIKLSVNELVNYAETNVVDRYLAQKIPFICRDVLEAQ